MSVLRLKLKASSYLNVSIETNLLDLLLAALACASNQGTDELGRKTKYCK